MHNSAHSERAPADRTRGTRLDSKLGKGRISVKRLDLLLTTNKGRNAMADTKTTEARDATAAKAETKAPEPQTALAVPDDTTFGFQTAAGFQLLQRGAMLLATSTLVPKEFQGNIPNCVIALNMASRMGADPLMVMQNLYVVHGRPGWSAQFLIATFNQNGRFTALRYEWLGTEADGDAWGCRAKTIEKSTGEELKGARITIKLAKDEGWYQKQGSKWQTMPEQMLMYRAASWFIRAYAPEIAMGLKTAEEIDDEVIDVTPEPRRGPTVVTPETLLGGAKVADVVTGFASGEDAADDRAATPSEQVAAAVKAAAEAADPDQPALPMGRGRKV